MLASLSKDDDSEVFVARVVEEYLMTLVRQAHIPIKYLESLREDLMTDVHDMLRIKTYGHTNLGEYLENKKSQPGTKKSRHN